MEVYGRSMTGNAAEWAINKQRSHQEVGQEAMMGIETLLNLI
jgi:hypothetical protein